MRKIIIIILTSFILNNCGYAPIYSSKENNFYIEKISQKNTSKLNSKIANNLKIFSNENSQNIIEIEINSVKKIEITQKDDKGDPSRFQMTIVLNMNIISENYNKTKTFSSDFNYSNDANKFSLKQYEKKIENNLISKIVEKSIIYLSDF